MAHWYLQVMALFLWAMPLKHGSSMVRTLIHVHMVEEFNSETLVLASDGSVLMDDATQAWILYGTRTDTCAYGHGPVPGGG